VDEKVHATGEKGSNIRGGIKKKGKSTQGGFKSKGEEGSREKGNASLILKKRNARFEDAKEIGG